MLNQMNQTAKINARFILSIFPCSYGDMSHRLALVAICLAGFEELLPPDADLFAFRSFFQHAQTTEVTP